PRAPIPRLQLARRFLVDAVLRELVQRDAGGDRDVQRIDVTADRNAHAVVGRAFDAGRQPRAFSADDQRELRGARACARTPGQSRSPARAKGTRSTAAIEVRIALR